MGPDPVAEASVASRSADDRPPRPGTPAAPWGRWDSAAVAVAVVLLLAQAVPSVLIAAGGGTYPLGTAGAALGAAGMVVLTARAAVICGSRERVVWVLYAAGMAVHVAAAVAMATVTPGPMAATGQVPGPVVALQVIAYLLFLAGSVALAVVARALATTASLLDTVLFVTAVVSLVAIVTPALTGDAGPVSAIAVGDAWLLFAIPPALNLAVTCAIALQLGIRREPWTILWVSSAVLLLAGATVLASYQESGHPGIQVWAPLLAAARLVAAGLPLWVIVRRHALTDDLPPLHRTTGPAVTVAIAAAVVAITASVTAAGGGGLSRADTIVAIVLVLLSLTLARVTISARLQHRISRSRQAQAQSWAQQSDAAVRNAERLRGAIRTLAPEVDQLRAAVEALHAAAAVPGADPASDRLSRAMAAVDDQLRGMAAFADVPVPAPVDTDVSELLEGVVRTNGPAAARAGVDLTVEVADADTAVVDPRILTRIVENLVSNAIRYAGPGTSAAVTATVDTSEVGTRNLVVVVSDTGRGIPERLRDAVFRPFYRVDPDDDVAGTGIGLSSAIRCAGALAGSLDLSETPGGGATFTLTVPADARLQEAGRR